MNKGVLAQQGLLKLALELELLEPLILEPQISPFAPKNLSL